MTLRLQNVVPEPLQMHLETAKSAIFGTECTFERGKKYIVTAASGKGKSTFMHILYGLRNDFTGTASIEGQDTRTLLPDDWSALRQAKIAIIFQDLRLFLPLTVEQNILVKTALTPQTDYATKAQKWAALLGIDTLWHQTCETLSYGQRQRVAILRALCQPFDFILLDEPFSHLDTPNIRIALDLIISETQQNNAGLILVSLGEKYGLTFDDSLVL